MKFKTTGKLINDLVAKHKLFVEKGKNPQRAVLKGANIKTGHGLIEICSLDGYVLLYSEFEVPGLNDEVNITVPFPQNKLTSDEVDVEISNESVTLSQESSSETLKALDGEYIGYQRMFPSDSKFGIVVSPKKLLDTLKAFKDEEIIYLQMDSLFSPIEISAPNQYALVLPVRREGSESWLRHKSENF